MQRLAQQAVIVICAGLAALLPGESVPSAPWSARAQMVGTHFERGVLMLHAKRYDLAAVALQRARELAPRVPEIHANLGFALLGLGELSLARQVFEQALQLNERQANAYYGLAVVADGLGDRATALGAMRTYVHLERSDSPYLRKARAALWEWQSGSVDAAWVLPALQGGVIDASTWQGKTAIVNVWAVWCAPCRAEMADLQKLSDQLDPQRYAVAGIAAQSDRFVAREWLRELNIRFPNAADDDGALVRQRLGVDNYPQTLVFSPDGRLALRLVGVQDWGSRAVRDQLARVAGASHKRATPARSDLAQ